MTVALLQESWRHRTDISHQKPLIDEGLLGQVVPSTHFAYDHEHLQTEAKQE